MLHPECNAPLTDGRHANEEPKRALLVDINNPTPDLSIPISVRPSSAMSDSCPLHRLRVTATRILEVLYGYCPHYPQHFSVSPYTGDDPRYDLILYYSCCDACMIDMPQGDQERTT
jgi:hypothetical protein